MDEKKLKSVAIGTVRREYPKDKELWVELYKDIPMGIAAELKEEDTESMFRVIASMIADWNFADADGIELERSVEGVKSLPSSIATWLAESTKDLVEEDEGKKKE